jgi:hypothetical protein
VLDNHAVVLDRSRALCAASRLVIDSAREAAAESVALAVIFRLEHALYHPRLGRDLVSPAGKEPDI